MFLRREGYPEDGELVFCTVTKIQYHAVTVELDEYDSKQGLIHISEVSPGRIRNMRDFVTEGKKVVCKVIRTDQSRGHIDLSLRRVNESQKRRKADDIKQEQKAEKIVEMLSEKIKKPAAELYKILSARILKEYDFLFLAFEDVVENNESLEKLGIDKAIAEPLESIIKDKIKVKQVEIISNVSFKTYDENGLEIVKQAFEKAKAIYPGLAVNYLGGGSYRILIVAKDYKEAEGIYKDIETAMTEFAKDHQGETVFKRQEK